MRLYIVSGILLIVPIVGFALAAPVLVQEKREEYTDIASIPEYPVTVFGKRAGEIEEAGVQYISDWFGQQGEKAATHPSSSSTPPSITEGLPPESDQASTVVHAPLSSPVLHDWFLIPHRYMGPHAPQPELGPSEHPLVVEEPPSRTASPTVSDGDRGFQVVHQPPPPPPPTTESDFEVVDRPPSSSMSESSTKPDRPTMGEDSNTSKGSPRISGTTSMV